MAQNQSFIRKIIIQYPWNLIQCKLKKPLSSINQTSMFAFPTDVVHKQMIIWSLNLGNIEQWQGVVEIKISG